VLGPGKAALLEGIQRHASIRAAAQEMGMSYMRAWKLVGTMNASFREPLVEIRRGGDRGGGASLTETGESALHLYRRMERKSVAAIDPLWRSLRRLLRN